MRVLFIDQSIKGSSVNALADNARGGRYNSMLLVPDALSRLGFECFVWAGVDSTSTTQAGTVWSNDLGRLPDSFSVLVANRGAGAGHAYIKAKHRVLWTHDLPHNGFAPDPRTLRAYARVVFMSKYAEAVWRTFFPSTLGKSSIIPNGVDREVFYPGVKDLGYLIYISAPNRGLKRLPLIFEAIKTRASRPVHMRAYSNMGKLHPGEVDDVDEDGYSMAYKSAQEAGIEVLDPVPPADLAKELGRAGLMILPTGYPEICSNAVLQALSCGTPIITTGNLGATQEWVRHGVNGMLTRWHPEDYMVHSLEMVRNAMAVLNNEDFHRDMTKRAAYSTGLFTWDEIGAKWAKMLKSL